MRSSILATAGLVMLLSWSCIGDVPIDEAKGRPPRDEPVVYGAGGDAETVPCQFPASVIVDPCETRSDFRIEGLAPAGLHLEDEPYTYEQLLANTDSSTHPFEPPSRFEMLGATHIILRGRFVPGTVRCASYPFLLPVWTDTGEEESVVLRPEQFEDHGVGTLRHHLCFSDFEVHEWFLSAFGPPVLTVAHPTLGYAYDIAALEDEADLDEIEAEIIEALANQTEDYEWVLWISPSYTTALEGWQVVRYWDLQRDGERNVIVVSPHFAEYKNRGYSRDDHGLLAPTLDSFRHQLEKANAARLVHTGGRIGVDKDTPSLLHDANYVEDYFREFGAYDGPFPTPAPPPPVPSE